MKLSHIVYKVNNLTKAFTNFQKEGFQVEYGSKTNPHNALIYFSEGPYIELVEQVAIPFYKRAALKLMGKQYVLDRLDRWGKAEEGPIDLCLENYVQDLKEEASILEKYNQPYFITDSKRLDPADRLLKWRLLFPYELSLPFLMTYFNLNPKPQNFVHPNGVKGIKDISFNTSKELIPLIQELCDDEVLSLGIGDGEINFSYEK